MTSKKRVRSRKKANIFSEATDPKASVIKMSRAVKQLIQILAFGLVCLYGWLQLKGVPLGPLVSNLSDKVIIRFSLVIYFTCWVLGANNDTDLQELVYRYAPSRGRLSVGGFGFIIGLAIVFGIMCYVKSSRQFAILLNLFLCINIFGWYYLARRLIPPVYEASKACYKKEKSYTSLFILDLVYHYLTGRWQWWRFAWGALLMIVMDLLIFTRLASYVEARVKVLTTATIVALGLFSFVLTMEAWIWYFRFKLMMAMATLEDFESQYKVVPIDCNLDGTIDNSASL